MSIYLNFLSLYFSYKFIIILKDYIIINPFKFINYDSGVSLSNIHIESILDKDIFLLSKNPEKITRKITFIQKTTTTRCDDFEKIDIDKGEFVIEKDLCKLNLKDILKYNYILIDLSTFSIYELKYIHTILLFFIDFEYLKNIKKSCNTIIIEIQTNKIYALKS